MKDGLALIGFEWAGTALRAWAFDDAGEILSSFQVREDPVAEHADWQARLQFHLAEWLGSDPVVPVIGCGDVSAPALNTPFSLAQLSANLGAKGAIRLVPWIGQLSPPDLTCGAETVLAGLDEAHGAICIAGQHTRHCVVEHGRLVEFSTEITAEMRDILLTHGSLSLHDAAAQAFDMKVFRDWIERALDTGDTPPVFSVEAAIRQGGLSAANKAAALAGLMIGADVAAHYDPGDEVLLVADGPLLEAYGFALDALGADVEETSAVEALQDGLFEIADLAGLLGED
ncbi:MAG: 2-dehydro-3-deoxygalactonokinase [Hyphomonas sp.]